MRTAIALLAACAIPALAAERAPVLPAKLYHGKILREHETAIVLGAGETLRDVARRHAIGLAWLIERNDLRDLPRAGVVLVVPRLVDEKSQG